MFSMFSLKPQVPSAKKDQGSLFKNQGNSRGGECHHLKSGTTNGNEELYGYCMALIDPHFLSKAEHWYWGPQNRQLPLIIENIVD